MQLVHDTLTLTVTRRLALRLEQRLSQQSTNGIIEPVFAIQDWFFQLWEHATLSLGLDWQLLSPLQEQALWLEIILSSQQGNDLLKPKQTAKQLMQTWKLLAEWRLDPLDLDWGQGQEHLICQQWMALFANNLKQKGLITSAQLPNLLLDVIQGSELARILIPYKSIQLSGFDDYTPQVQAWLDWFAESGIQIATLQAKISSRVSRYAFASPNEELAAVASYAKTWTEQNPGKQFGLVIPDLINMRFQVEDVFNQVCQPQACAAPDFQVSDQFNISAGQMLSQYPIVQALLSSFELIKPKVEVNAWVAYLQSPFFEHDSEEATLKFIAQLVDLKRKQIAFSELIKLDTSQTPLFAKQLTFMQDFRKMTAQTCSVWLKHMVAWQQQLGWPGPRVLNSPEHQVMARFQLVLKEWSQISAKKMTLTESLQWLMTICSDLSFQPESKPASIQIMGLLEAAGQTFDKLWVLGLNSETWPAKPAPDPFIPYGIQIEHQMPHSSPTRELKFAQHLIDSLEGSAKEVCFSYAVSQQGKVLFPSPLIEKHPEQPLNEVIEHHFYKHLQRPEALESAESLTPIAFKDEQIRGGVSLIQDQSQCPFKAFAKHRLHMADMSPESEGVNALTRGVLMHDALELVWAKLQTQQNLLALDDKALDALIHEVLTELTDKQKLPEFYGEIELRRLHLLMMSWLAVEKQRKPFHVAKTEVNAQVKLGSLNLSCRLDRVDVDEAGHFIIIDYKSGHVSLKDCFGERPDAPQLPLYCLANFPPEPHAVVYAQIKRDNCQFIGISEQPNLLPKVLTVDKVRLEEGPNDWQDCLSQWRHTLNTIADSFMAGEHQVAPKSPLTCRYCHLSSFCRVQETQDV